MVSTPTRGRGGSFRSRGGRGGVRGGGRGGRGGRGDRRGYDEGPPAEIVELGVYLHAVEGEMLYSCTNTMVPYFNAGAYMEGKSKIGKIDEILGNTSQLMFTVKPDPGIVATSYKAGDKVYIGTDKLLPMSRFTGNGPPPIRGGRGRGGGRGGRGGGFRGRGGDRGRGRGMGFRGRGRGNTPRGGRGG